MTKLCLIHRIKQVPKREAFLSAPTFCHSAPWPCVTGCPLKEPETKGFRVVLGVWSREQNWGLWDQSRKQGTPVQLGSLDRDCLRRAILFGSLQITPRAIELLSHPPRWSRATRVTHVPSLMAWLCSCAGWVPWVSVIPKEKIKW